MCCVQRHRCRRDWRFALQRTRAQPPVLPPTPQWVEPEWKQVAPGIECKLLATDTERHRVSMLVRLAPGARYPAHTHAGVEELISFTVSCGSTSASSSRATTTMVRRAQLTSMSGARPDALACSLPVRMTSCIDDVKGDVMSAEILPQGSRSQTGFSGNHCPTSGSPPQDLTSASGKTPKSATRPGRVHRRRPTQGMNSVSVG